jgi:hypothetical protein
LHMVRYDAALVSQLPPASRPPSFPSYLDSRIPALAKLSDPELACELWFFQEYYFALNSDAVRRQRAIAAAVLASPVLAGTESVLLETRELSQLGWQRVKSFTFESKEVAWTPEGDASDWLTAALRPDQEYPLGRKGRFVDSFVPVINEASTGRLRSPPFAIEADLVTFVIGGGKSLEAEKLELLVDNLPVRAATGCNSEWLGRRVWNVSMYRGKTGHLVITDASGGQWGHVLVDEIELWKRAE